MFDNNIIHNILRNTASGKDFKNFSLVSKTWRSIIESIFPGGDKFANHLLTLISMFPEEDWNTDFIKTNPSIPDKPHIWKFIEDKLQKPVVQKYGYPRSLTWELVVNNPNINWNMQELSRHPNITVDIIKNNPNSKWGNWDYGSFSFLNRNVTWQLVMDNPDIPWNYELLFYNIQLTEAMICDDNFWHEYGERILPHQNIRSTSDLTEDVYFECLSRLNIDSKFIEKNPGPCDSGWGWNYYEFKKPSSRFSEKFVIENLHRNWNYECLCTNPNLSFELLESIASKNSWCRSHLSSSPNLTWRIVAKNPSRWNYIDLSMNRFALAGSPRS